MTMNSIMGKPLKHYAVDKNTRARYFMLALENDTDKNTCSVVDMDAMSSEMRAELTETINSDECQRVIDPWKVLDTKFFMNYPKQTMLKVLQALRLIKVLPSDDVLIQLPNEQTQTPKEVMNAIREYNKQQLEKHQPQQIIVNQELNEETRKLEEKNAEDIKELKEKVDVLTSSISELVSALKSKKK